MIRVFTLNVSEDILNKFKDIEVNSYYCDNCNPVAFIYEDDILKYHINDANYVRINSCILKLRG